MNCQKYQKYITAFVDGELSPEKLEVIREHLNQCNGCQKLLKLEAFVKDLVGTKLPILRAPDFLRRHILRKMDKINQIRSLWEPDMEKIYN